MFLLLRNRVYFIFTAIIVHYLNHDRISRIMLYVYLPGCEETANILRIMTKNECFSDRSIYVASGLPGVYVFT